MLLRKIYLIFEQYEKEKIIPLKNSVKFYDFVGDYYDDIDNQDQDLNIILDPEQLKFKLCSADCECAVTLKEPFKISIDEVLSIYKKGKFDDENILKQIKKKLDSYISEAKEYIKSH